MGLGRGVLLLLLGRGSVLLLLLLLVSSSIVLLLLLLGGVALLGLLETLLGLELARTEGDSARPGC